MPARIIKHNPAFLTPEELRASFTVRLAELESLIRIVRENTGQANQHVLVIGPRGYGKSMLVRRLALAIRETVGLGNRWLPIVLPEEAYSISTAGELWLEALRIVPDCGVRNPERWRAAHEKLRIEQDPERLREQVLARLFELADEEGKRLLIAVENFNLLFDEQASDDAGWDIRKTMLGDSRIMMVATATQRFDEVEKAKKSMYELFREIKLERLTQAECKSMWENVVKSELEGERARAVQILTGGNPRLVAILASFSVGRPFREILGELDELIDDHTTYFKACIEGLSPLERRVFVTLAELWKPAGAREAARLARENVNKCSQIMGRLVQRGAVMEVEMGQKGRKKLYQVAERLFNLYLLMRQSGTQAQRARGVVEFMVPFYGPVKFAAALSKEAVAARTEDRPIYLEAWHYLRKRFATEPVVGMEVLSATDSTFREWPETRALIEAIEGGDLLRDGESQDRELRELRSALSSIVVDMVKGNFETAVADLDNFISRYRNMTDPRFARLVGVAYAMRSDGLVRLGRKEEGIAAIDEMARRLDGRQETAVMNLVASGLVRKGDALRDLGRPREAAAVYDDIVSLSGQNNELALAEPVVIALLRKGQDLREQGRYKESIGIFDDVLSRFDRSPDLATPERVADVLIEKGFALGRDSQHERAIAMCDAAVEKLVGREEAASVEGRIKALMLKALLLEFIGRDEESLARYDDAIVLCSTREESSFEQMRVVCTSGKAGVYLRMNRLPDALSTCEALLAQSPNWEGFVEDVIDLAIQLAARGLAGEVLGRIEASAHAGRFEPLMAGLRMYIGQEITVPVEVREIATDVVGRIKASMGVGKVGKETEKGAGDVP
ncbi:MAG: ATP-binding protein [Nitrospirae bacterium]|nr:ATP-binding protein [Nitrospirota bacterium]